MQKNKKGGIAANLMFFFTALIWGFSFVAQRQGADYLAPFAFNAIRYFLGAAALLPVILIFERDGTPWKEKKLLLASLAAGFVLYTASSLQQAGVSLTGDAGKSGFITGLYTVLVPILYAVFFRVKAKFNIWLGAVLATVGLYLISVTGDLSSVSIGDLLLFIGAFFWAGHIIVVDRMGSTLTSLRFAFLQFIVAGILSWITAWLFEAPILAENVRAAAIPLLYCAVMSTGVGYTLQIIGQKLSSNPALAAIIFSLESVFAALGGMLLLHERMRVQGYIGCMLIFAGIIMSQIAPKEKSKK